MKKLFFLIGVIFSCALVPLFAQDDSKPWERLGLSITEWKLIQDNNLPMNKVEELLKAGINIGEYFQHPWETMDMTEEEWVAKHRRGMTSEEIDHEYKTLQEDFIKNEKPVENAFQEYDDSKEKNELFVSFIAPGFLQCRDKRTMQGRIMIGVAAGAVAGCAALSISKKQFISLPLFVILIPDMFWSMFEHKKNKKASGG